MEEFCIGKFEFQSQYIEASAGTGKTYSIVEMVKKLIGRGGEDGKLSVAKPVELSEILLVTYTEKAVGELKDRIYGALGKMPDVYTIHSFCRELLGTYPMESRCPVSASVVDEKSLLDEFMQRRMRDFYSRDDDFKLFLQSGKKPDEFVETVTNGIGKYYLDANGKEDKGVVSFKVSDDEKDVKKNEFLKDAIIDSYKEWQKEKARRSWITFSDMLKFVRDAVVKEDSGLRERIREKYRVAIIDEFQDTNQLQWDIFREVFLDAGDGKSHCLIVVGDPKQSIYSFQGADVNVYKKAVAAIGKGFLLRVNYRSTDKMVGACNALFGGDYFADAGNNVELSMTFATSDSCGLKCNAEFDGKEDTEPVWLAECVGDKGEMSGAEYAEMVVDCIRRCCERKGGRTRLQVFDKSKEDKDEKNSRLRDVSYDDFAVLAKSKSHFSSIENCLKKAGIPFVRYKDDSLFSGREIQSWLSLLSTIDAPDFSGDNKKTLRECLVSLFFEKPISAVASEDFWKDDSSEKQQGADEKSEDVFAEQRDMIKRWRVFAGERKWAELFDSIIAESGIEGRLFRERNYQAIGKIRQLSKYILDYIFRNNCGLREAIAALGDLKKREAELGRDEKLIELSNESRSVRLMTMHSSKGLEFPVVICASNFPNNNKSITSSIQDKVFVTHEEGGARIIFDKDAYKPEWVAEVKRLFYVCFTRASSLLIIPHFKGEKKAESGEPKKASGDKGKDKGETPKTNFTAFLDAMMDRILPEDDGTRGPFAKTFAKAVTEKGGSKKGVVKKGEGAGFYSMSGEQKKRLDEQKLKIENLYEKTKSQFVGMESYSSVSHRNGIIVEAFDRSGVAIPISYGVTPASGVFLDLPKGADYGNAVHSILEKLDFTVAKNGRDSLMGDVGVNNLVCRCLANEGINPEIHRERTMEMLYAVLRAKLPYVSAGCGEVAGGKAADKEGISLCDVGFGDRISEANFDSGFNDFGERWRGKFFNGSVDLLFRHRVKSADGRGREVYSVVDWKTDAFESPELYADGGFLKAHTDERYSVQRVLYAYTVMKMLVRKTGRTPEEVFREYFGGVYYVYVKGAAADGRNGIYAHTWKSFADLKSEYDRIVRYCGEREVTA